MSVSIIDGTIESADLKRSAMKLRIYRSIVFRLANGETKTVAKPIVHADLATHLVPGTSGRFYLFSSIDHRGIHGIRTATGQRAYAYPRNNELTGLGLTLFGLFWMVLSYSVPELFSGWIVIVLVIGPLVWLYNWKLRSDAQRQYESDDGPAQGPVTAAG